MKALPPPLASVMVPLMYSPTSLVTAGACKLKATLGSIKIDRLPSGPEAAVGTLIHRVLERTCGKPSADVDGVFESEYEKLREELEKDCTRAHFCNLASTRTLSEWSGLRAWIRTRSLRGKVTTPAIAIRDIPGLGAEQLLESSTLRLRGRADRVRRLGPHMLEVRDFKSGATLDSDGQIKSEIALQLKAYGLMLIELNPGFSIRLVVDDGEEREIEFDARCQERAREELMTLVSDLPMPGDVSVEMLAVPGPSCWRCPFRHRCSAYLAIAPAWWKGYPQEVDRVAFDTWGILTDFERGEASLSVRLTDSIGRPVRVGGLTDRHGLSAERIGQPVHFFGLEATGPSRDFDGNPYHPRSFHELPRDRTERTAWTATAFAGA